jgi:hypothetical protein
MLIDMIHDNHGEPPFKTRYRDPAALKARGYQAIVIPDALAHIPAAYPTGFRQPSTISTQGPAAIEAEINARVQSALALNMNVFFYADALLLPRHIVEKDPAAFLCEDNSGRLCAAKPAVFAALADQVHELFDRWPAASGLIMRTVEVYPEATPHMIGSPLHASNCPVCRSVGLVERLTTFIRAMHDVVVAELKKTYVHRAWQPSIANLPNMHDDPEAYRLISGRLPQSPDLAFSFKFTRGDFLTGQRFNPCLLADDRPKWIEFQCEREYEGKGAFPNFQGPVWQQFLMQLALDAGAKESSDLHKRFNIWGWSRGGGWGGPYVQREEWIDANVYALAELYKSADGAVQDIATAWIAATFGVAESAPQTPAIAELLMLSAPTIRKLLYVRGSASDHLPWLKDDLLDVNAIWASAMHVLDAANAEEAIAEKREAQEGAERIRHLFDLAAPGLPNPSQAKALSNSLAYYSSFAGSVVSLFVGFIRFAQWHRGGRTNAALATEATDLLEHAQAHWQHHTQRHALLAGAPSVFQENTLWDRTNDCLEQLQNAE